MNNKNSLPLLSEGIKQINTFCYIHIPFCTSKCKYCRFASYWNIDAIKINLYIENLLKEIKEEKIDFKFLKSIYLWWWTPSVLSIKQLEQIINSLKDKYDFDKKIEINIEATPVTVTKSNIIWWKKIWINRISIWVQTLNNKSLKEIWRDEKWDIFTALNNLKSVWFENVSIDLIIGLPYVKKWEQKKYIEYILHNYSFIKHVSVYMLEEYYDIPEIKDSNFENITYPDNWDKLWILEDDYLWEYSEIKELLISKWYNPYEISNFAKQWYECKHNQAYWNHSNILAFWLWAHSFINNERYSNSENFIEYYFWKKEIQEKLYSEDLFIEKIMFNLRTSWLSKNDYEKLNKSKIDELVEWNYLMQKDDKLVLTNRWILVMDYILSEII